MGLSEFLLIAKFAVEMYGVIDQSSVYHHTQCYQQAQVVNYPEKSALQRTNEEIRLDNYINKMTYESDQWMSNYISNLPQ